MRARAYIRIYKFGSQVLLGYWCYQSLAELGIPSLSEVALVGSRCYRNDKIWPLKAI